MGGIFSGAEAAKDCGEFNLERDNKCEIDVAKLRLDRTGDNALIEEYATEDGDKAYRCISGVRTDDFTSILRGRKNEDKDAYVVEPLCTVKWNSQTLSEGGSPFVKITGNKSSGFQLAWTQTGRDTWTRLNARPTEEALLETKGEVATLTGEKTGLQGRVDTLTGEKTGLQDQVDTLSERPKACTTGTTKTDAGCVPDVTQADLDAVRRELEAERDAMCGSGTRLKTTVTLKESFTSCTVTKEQCEAHLDTVRATTPSAVFQDASSNARAQRIFPKG